MIIDDETDPFPLIFLLSVPPEGTCWERSFWLFLIGFRWVQVRIYGIEMRGRGGLTISILVWRLYI